MKPLERLIRFGAKEAVAILAIRERKLWEITPPRGPVPVVKFARAVRYRLRDLEAFIQQ